MKQIFFVEIRIMTSSLPFFTLLSLLPFLLQPVQCHPTDQQEKSFRISKYDSKPATQITPTAYFEVSKPIELPNTKPCSSYLLLQHDFAYTYQKPPVLVNYTPPSDCPDHNFSMVVLEWKAEVKGEQFDRIFGIWLGGVEILRSSTAEPTVSGIVWTVQKDITKYSSLLKANQTLAVYLGNIIDNTYNGTYHVNISMHFYPGENREYGLDQQDNSSFGFDSVADLILPISRNLPLSDGLWFEIENSTDVEFKEFRIPQNAYRAVLEVYVSFHEKDEFWYTNFPNEYIDANNISEATGNGPFREVVISLDDKIIAAVWPFTVVYTGGINPLMWMPITGIGSFDLPTYDIEVTPFLGRILDCKTHRFGFSVTNALNVWYVNANLHLWLDKKSAKTKGELLIHDISPLIVSSIANFSGLNGSFVTNVNRSISSVGLVYSSRGNITTKASQGLSYTNSMLLMNEGNQQFVEQMILSDDQVFANIPSSLNYSILSINKFPISLNTTNVDQGNKTYEYIANISMGFNQKKIKVTGSGISVSSLENLQTAQGYVVVKDGNTIEEGLGSTEQAYKYVTDESCYFRNVKSSNLTIDFDNTSNDCNSTDLCAGLGLTSWSPAQF